MMMKCVANKVKLNGLLSGECCYRGGTTAFACPAPYYAFLLQLLQNMFALAMLSIAPTMLFNRYRCLLVHMLAMLQTSDNAEPKHEIGKCQL